MSKKKVKVYKDTIIDFDGSLYSPMRIEGKGAFQDFFNEGCCYILNKKGEVVSIEEECGNLQVNIVDEYGDVIKDEARDKKLAEDFLKSGL